MKMLKIALVLVVLPAVAAEPRSTVYDFKGVEIGVPATPQDVESKLGIKCGVGGKHNQLQVCNGATTVAKERAKLNLVIGPTGLVERILLTIDADSFDSVEPEIVRKFGSPTKRETPTIQNRYGAIFQQTIDTWAGENGVRVEFKRYAGNVEDASLYFSTESDRRLLRGDDEDRSGDI